MATDATKNRCCTQVDECREMYPSWACSTWYNNTVYAKYVCPYTPTICGLGKDTVTVTNTDTLTITNMGRGDVCFYRLKNTCGRLKLDVDGLFNTAETINGILLEYLEFETENVVIGSANEVMHGRLGGAPSADMPWRSESFVPSGMEKVWQGRIFKDRGSHYWGSDIQGLAG